MPDDDTWLEPQIEHELEINTNVSFWVPCKLIRRRRDVRANGSLGLMGTGGSKRSPGLGCLIDLIEHHSLEASLICMSP